MRRKPFLGFRDLFFQFIESFSRLPEHPSCMSVPHFLSTRHQITDQLGEFGRIIHLAPFANDSEIEQ